MSLLAVGISHRTAPVSVLERAVVGAELLGKLLDELIKCDNVTEVMILSTCNRVEFYAEVDAFHAGLNDVTGVLARHAGADVADLTEFAYVHYAGAAVEHLFNVTAGLDSMVVGEPQILGQLRSAYATADQAQTVGKVLHDLCQQALRVGKRVHSETDIDHAAGSVVAEALNDADTALGGLTGRRALVVGAGSMAGLAVSRLKAAAVGHISVINRTAANAERLAANAVADGVPAAGFGLEALAGELARAEVVFACTGSVDTVVTLDDVAAAIDGRTAPLVICDLGLPKDVDAAVEGLAGALLIDLTTLQRRLSDAPSGVDTQAAVTIVAEELRAYFAAQRSAEVTPTVTALRRRAADVVNAELLRLDNRLPDLDDGVRAELAQTVRRVVDKLLHAPTVRVKELAAGPKGAGYADALRELFELDPGKPAAVSQITSSEQDGGTR
ncbi:glutamyl-tRNA reductase [Pseudonocardiaceae bacterium YIM PH 21723]|nr:glutamyl-tRNA reductase [Pseudonocardiaceae bacterium YIM PH 21723]